MSCVTQLFADMNRYRQVLASWSCSVVRLIISLIFLPQHLDLIEVIYYQLVWAIVSGDQFVRIFRRTYEQSEPDNLQTIRSCSPELEVNLNTNRTVSNMDKGSYLSISFGWGVGAMMGVRVSRHSLWVLVCDLFHAAALLPLYNSRASSRETFPEDIWIQLLRWPWPCSEDCEETRSVFRFDLDAESWLQSNFHWSSWRKLIPYWVAQVTGAYVGSTIIQAV